MKHVLLVEDNPADVELIRESFAECGVEHRLSVVEDGQQALAFVRHQGPYAHAERPDLILLDLNLPRIDGRQVLKELKADPELRLIPVVVVTSSDAESDIRRAYANGANSYVRKVIDLDEFIRAVHALEAFWLAVAKLP